MPAICVAIHAGALSRYLEATLRAYARLSSPYAQAKHAAESSTPSSNPLTALRCSSSPSSNSVSLSCELRNSESKLVVFRICRQSPQRNCKSARLLSQMQACYHVQVQNAQNKVHSKPGMFRISSPCQRCITLARFLILDIKWAPAYQIVSFRRLPPTIIARLRFELLCLPSRPFMSICKSYKVFGL